MTIKVSEVEKIHAMLIDKFGGSKGIRDRGLLQSAINRPFATFDQKDLYPTPIEKAAALIESVLINHPFIDGNKRTGYVLTRLLLLQNGQDIEANQNDKYDFVIAISKGELNFDAIKDWLTIHVVKKK